MRQYLSIYMTLVLIGIFPIQAQAKETHQWKSHVDIPLMTTTIAFGLFSQHRFRTLEPVDLNQLNKQDVPIYDRWAISLYSPTAGTLSDILLIGALAPLYLGWQYSQEQQEPKLFWLDVLMYSETLLLSSSLNLWVRSLGSKPRPLVYNTSAPLAERQKPEASSSFYSGHTSGAFATAVFTSTLFMERYPRSPWIPWVWGGSLSVASTVGTLRVLAGKHYPSDILVGALVGSLFGYGIPWLHKVSNKSPRYSLLPILPTPSFFQNQEGQNGATHGFGLLGTLKF
jgi:membrane-associated phospholipid phosphatase